MPPFCRSDSHEEKQKTMPVTRHRQNTIAEGLTSLGIDDANSFEGCDTREEEFRVVKKHYFRQCLKHHPDKANTTLAFFVLQQGGDAAKFREVQTAFELLRDLHSGKQKRKSSADTWYFSDCFTGATNAPTSPGGDEDDDSYHDDDEEAFDMSAYDFDFANMETPSWEYYQEAASETMPPYRVEPAKSSRGKCAQKGKYKKCELGPPKKESVNVGSTELDVPRKYGDYILQGEVRAGRLNGKSGFYTEWRHLRCWRIPYKVWVGLPDPETCQDPKKFEVALARMNQCVLSGFDDLPESEQKQFVEHCQDKSNWARKTTRRKAAQNEPPVDKILSEASLSTSMVVSKKSRAGKAPQNTSNTSIVTGRERFVMPKPGRKGASHATVFDGLTFVLTGVFPEVGGGAGLNLGKDKAKAMIQSFGGRVTSSVSGKTDVLVVGKEPGMSKVSKARSSSKIVMASIKDLKEGLDRGCETLEQFDMCNRSEPMKIQAFSKGYQYSRGGYNGLALQASKSELAVAHGLQHHDNEAPGTDPRTLLLQDDVSKPAASSRKRKQKDGTAGAVQAAKKKKKRKKVKSSEPEGSAAIVPNPKKRTRSSKRKLALKNKKSTATSH